MEWLYVYWGLIIFCFVLSFVGIAFPIIPSPFFLWLGFLMHYFLITKELSIVFFIAMFVLTIILIISDIIANSYFVKKYGGSKTAERIAGLGVIVGSFIFPPFGVILIPFIAVLITELFKKKTFQQSIYVSFGSFIGFLSGTVAKIMIQVIMIVWFFIEI